jgi:alpha-tubulin suppressor-like RCC1 family protein
MTFSIGPVPRQLAWLAVLSTALVLIACGGGGGEAAPVNPNTNLPGGVTPTVTPPPATLTASGPTRVVANTVLSYSASVANGTATAFSWAWGDATPSTPGAVQTKVWNQLGNSNAVVAATLSSGSQITTALAITAVAQPVAAGQYHTCAIEPAGTVRCWGENSVGQMGNGTTATTTLTSQVTGLGNVVALGSSLLHSCALQAAGSVRCWGFNSTGQLGNGTATSSIATSVSVAVTGLTDAVALATGINHNCAIKANGTVVCWGHNATGQLGNNTTTQSLTPTAVTGLTSAVAISANGVYSCAVLSSGGVRCWGSNSSGQLGNGTTAQSLTPVAVTGLTDAVSIATSSYHACAITSSGAVRCWGFNAYGQLGNGTTATSTVTVAVTGITNAVAVSAGQYHTCALLAGGSVRCWGAGMEGQLGNGTTASAVVSPAAVSGLSDTVSVSAGRYHTCALRTGGAVSCWGDNNSVQLGDGTSDPSDSGLANKLVPTPVQGGSVYWK